MDLLISLLVGLMVAGSVHLLLTGHLVRMLFGLSLLSTAVNLIIFVVGRLTYGAPALIPPDQDTISGAANALPQALILTAIVIGFGLLTFAIILARQVYASLGTVHLHHLVAGDEDDEDEDPVIERGRTR